MKRLVAPALFALLLAIASPSAQEAPAFDTSYRVSPSVSARVQRAFLTEIRWSQSAALRDSLAASFAEKSPLDRWQELVARDGLTTGNVADALTSFWVLSWITANAAYGIKIDNAPIRRQLEQAFASDAAFATLTDQQRQEMAEGYILQFLVQHAALNAAVERKDIAALNQLSAAAVLTFREEMGVDLLGLVPGPEGFQPKTPASTR
ncbi:DUF6683 family protein [Devosia rhizoryzae]|uniref:Uncharacterized protein n=1 Tax=Devosia rhizoryzae TaxID=2774137 RepID=A0ABX7C104_9HYPH|nr:DUF6683 family protein [Devosia rhizoryzae]QQR37912.1 hypothetical protein JI748_08830 [Devosia rhizoryzae]